MRGKDVGDVIAAECLVGGQVDRATDRPGNQPGHRVGDVVRSDDRDDE